MKSDYSVRQVSSMDCEKYILGIHYAKRFPSVTFSFGLFFKDKLKGIVTYGTPLSSTLRDGVCGSEYSGSVLELNRLCLESNKKNEASLLISQSLKLIDGDRVIVSFADGSKGHHGYIYQATNFLYTGLSAKRSDWKVRGREHLHSQTIADEFRGLENRAQLMREKYGDDFYLEDRPRKHRYIYFIGNKRFKRKALSDLKYNVLEYPKGDNALAEPEEILKSDNLDLFSG